MCERLKSRGGGGGEANTNAKGKILSRGKVSLTSRSKKMKEILLVQSTRDCLIELH